VAPSGVASNLNGDPWRAARAALSRIQTQPQLRLNPRGLVAMRSFLAILLCMIPPVYRIVYSSTRSASHDAGITRGLPKAENRVLFADRARFFICCSSGQMALSFCRHTRGGRWLRTRFPTCKERISPDKVKEILRLMIDRRFWELPEKTVSFFIGDLPSLQRVWNFTESS